MCVLLFGGADSSLSLGVCGVCDSKGLCLVFAQYTFLYSLFLYFGFLDWFVKNL